MGAVDRGGKLGDGVQTDVALEGRGDPRADTLFASSSNPLTTTCHTTMQRGFEDDVSRFDDMEHVSLHLGVVHANEFLIEGDGQRRLPTEFRHIGPLTLFDRLFDAVDGILGEEFQFIEGFFILERTIATGLGALEEGLISS